MIVKLPNGTIVAHEHLQEGDIVRGYVSPEGFIADDNGRQWGVRDSEQIIPFFGLSDAKKYAKVRPRFKKWFLKG